MEIRLNRKGLAADDFPNAVQNSEENSPHGRVLTQLKIGDFPATQL